MKKSDILFEAAERLDAVGFDGACLAIGLTEQARQRPTTYLGDMPAMYPTFGLFQPESVPVLWWRRGADFATDKEAHQARIIGVLLAAWMQRDTE